MKVCGQMDGGVAVLRIRRIGPELPGEMFMPAPSFSPITVFKRPGAQARGATFGGQCAFAWGLRAAASRNPLRSPAPSLQSQHLTFLKNLGTNRPEISHVLVTGLSALTIMRLCH